MSAPAKDGYRYWAFISYSHADERWGRWLHRALETYRVPRRLVGRPGRHGPLPRRLFPVFRDRDELPTASDLGDKIRAALRDSRFLVVICSPKAAVSRWVNEEIGTFKAAGGEDRVLCLIVDGEPYASEKPDAGLLECFPRAVRFEVDASGQPTETRTEPLAADARSGKDGAANARLKLLAGMLEVSFDELKQRERRRRFWRRLQAGIAALAVVGALAGVWATGERARNLRTAQFFLTKARDAAGRDDDALASFYGAQSIRRSLMAGRAPLDADFLSSLALAAMPDATLADARLANPLAVSPDGALVFAAPDADHGHLWDLERRGPRASIPSAPGRFTHAAFDGGDRRVATATEGGAVQVWSAVSGALEATAQAQGVRVSALALTPDGRLLAWAGDGGAITLWRLDRPARVATLRTGERVHCLAFSADGARLASGSEEHTVRVWDVAAPGPGALLAQAAEPVRSLAFSPDGALLAAGMWDSTVKLLDLRARREIATLAGRSGHLQAVESVAFAGDGTLLASASLDRTVKLWEVSSQALVATLTGHPDGVTGVAFGAKGEALTSASRDGTVKQWHVVPRRYRAALTGHTGAVRSVAFSPDGRVLASAADDKSIRLWDVATRQARLLPPQHTDSIRALAFSPDGRWLASAGRDERIVLWNVATGAIVNSVRAHDDWIFALAFLPGASPALVSAGWTRDPTVKRWTLPELKATTLGRHEGPVGGLAVSRDGRFVASASNDATVKLWDLATHTSASLPAPHKVAMRAVAFSPDGHLLAAGGAEAWLQLWDAARRQPAAPAFRAHHTRGHETTLIWSLAFSPDGRLLATGSNSLDRQTVRLWSVDERRTVAWLTGHREFALTVAFSPDGRWLASGGTDRTVRLWRVADFWPPGLAEPAAVTGALLRGFLARQITTTADADDLVAEVGHVTGLELVGNEAQAVRPGS